MLTFKKDDKTKFIEKDSKLIPILEADGWAVDKPKSEPKKKKKNDDSK